MIIISQASVFIIILKVYPLLENLFFQLNNIIKMKSIFYLEIQFFIIIMIKYLTNLFLLLILICLSQAITLRLKKESILVPLYSSYTSEVFIWQGNSQIMPIKAMLNHSVFNTISTINQYFDYFKYLSPAEIDCYKESILNSSYLYPCPFILNNDSSLRVVKNSEDLLSQFSDFQKNNTLSQSFIVDNTPYPFPTGSYPYTDLYVSTVTNLTINFANNYRSLGVRLIFISITLFLIYGTVISILVYKINKIQKEMIQRKPDYKLKRRISELSKQDLTNAQDQQSDIDDYENVVPNELTLRQSRDSRQYREYKVIPSLISSSRLSWDQDQSPQKSV